MKFGKINMNVVLVCMCMYLCVRPSAGSAWLQDPPSRSAAWYYQVQTPVNYNFRNLDCGGQPVEIQPDGSRNCGLCGDAVTDPLPRPNEIGGTYANPAVRTRYYESGQDAHFSIWNNLPGSPGFYEFRLCTDAANPSWSCFNEHLLYIEDYNSTRMPVPATTGVVMVHAKLPASVTCSHCVVQWRFRKDDSVVGCDSSNWCGLGRGPQVEYYNCADVTIGAVGQPKPSFIQDPVYSELDYGGSYDAATTLVTTPSSNGLDNGTVTVTVPTTTAATTTTAAPTTTTTDVPIIIIPTVPPVTTTTTSGTGGITTQRQTPPTSEQLVVDANGNVIPTLDFTTGNSGGGNNRLLLLLALLPLIGAATLRSGATAAAAAPALVPPMYPVSYLLPIVPGTLTGSGVGFGVPASSWPLTPMAAGPAVNYVAPAMPGLLPGSGIGFGNLGTSGLIGTGIAPSAYTGTILPGILGNAGLTGSFSDGGTYSSGSSNYYRNKGYPNSAGNIESLIYKNANTLVGNSAKIMAPGNGPYRQYSSQYQPIMNQVIPPRPMLYPTNQYQKPAFNPQIKYVPPQNLPLQPVIPPNNGNGPIRPNPPEFIPRAQPGPVEPAARFRMQPRINTIAAQPTWKMNNQFSTGTSRFPSSRNQIINRNNNNQFNTNSNQFPNNGITQGNARSGIINTNNNNNRNIINNNNNNNNHVMFAQTVTPASNAFDWYNQLVQGLKNSKPR